ncbi:TetR/AcrR family transcriptional regulator [Reyranella sp. CPCC 100927]|uniref:TetR/AcrR family transcriptional regulator n=1 Tax=Reyranella sp. CPCC 100927 TaxID=2599616 RepID=UPI0011B59F74|nr:TetR/AcrR family transcriptional regulator [Reyranella sp. CPCC 100927]TWT11656.1 TetR/AcrR family transcriptional regulator [Reyranella sp. CPCC 100927]
MARKPRSEMIVETRAKLLAAARQAFGTVGYAAASMDDFTAAAGLTRGALYHHFGDKKGLLEAVIAQIDAEMSIRLSAVSARAANPWQGFVDECTAYIEMALEPEIQRIVLRDGPAALGDPWQWPTQSACIRSMTASLQQLIDQDALIAIDPEAAARLINGATVHAAQWIAHADDPVGASKKAVRALNALLDGLRSQSSRGAGSDLTRR